MKKECQNATDSRDRIAEVWLKQKNKRIDAAYDYLIPPDLSDQAVPGVRVVVPFGNGSRLLQGFIDRIKTESAYDEALKPIHAVIDEMPVLTDVQRTLCRWIHRYYGALFYESLILFTAPVKVVQKRGKKSDDGSAPVFEAYCPKKRSAVSSGGKTEFAARKTVVSDPEPFRDWIRIVLQSETVCFFECESQRTRFETYCHLAEEIRRQHGQTVILLPESFALHVLQPVFDGFFGLSGCIYSSELKPSKRYEVFQGVKKGEISVVLGTRAALFLPYANLKLIIMDDPDDNTYFARSMPHYDTLRVAQTYAGLSDARLFLGGSVLPLQIYHGVRQHRIRHIKNENRVFPQIEMVDMQSEMRRGNLDFISGLLKQRMEETIACGKRILLMLNRLGLAGYMLCRQCGHVEKCSRCGISLRPYTDGKLYCPYCGETRRIPDRCPNCHSVRFKPVGLGVEKAAEVLNKRYPQWRILQLDAQMLADEKSFAEIRAQLDSGNWDVIIGTRVLLKDWQFQSIGLTAVLLMDEAFNHGDYNDSERAALLFKRFFALSGKYAVGQTYEPEHEVVEMLMDPDQTGFYENELSYRKLMHYPPFCHLVIFNIMDLSSDQAGEDAETLYRSLSGFYSKMPSGQFFQIYQPVLAGVQPKTGRIRFKIMLKISQIALFHQILSVLISTGEIEKLKSRVSIVIDPRETV